MGKISLVAVGKLSYLRLIMFDIEAFKTKAKAYCDGAGIKLATLGAYAVSDKTVFDRLNRGGNVGVLTLQRIVVYMNENPRGQSEPVEGRDHAVEPADFPASELQGDAA